MWLFLFRMNRFSIGGEGDRNIGEVITKAGNRKQMNRAKKKWVDDLSEVTAIKLNEVAVTADETSLQRPLPWHARTEHVLPEEDNPAKDSLIKLAEVSSAVGMVMNTKKTKTMIFSRMRKTDIKPFISKLMTHLAVIR